MQGYFHLFTWATVYQENSILDTGPKSWWYLYFIWIEQFNSYLKMLLYIGVGQISVKDATVTVTVMEFLWKYWSANSNLHVLGNRIKIIKCTKLFCNRSKCDICIWLLVLVLCIQQCHFQNQYGINLGCGQPNWQYFYLASTVSTWNTHHSAILICEVGLILFLWMIIELCLI